MKITKDQGIIFAKEFDERLPAVQTGLVHHIPMDGKGGAFDMIGGVQTAQNIEIGINLIDLMNLNWRNPASWSDAGCTWDETKQAIKWVGYHNAWLNTPIIVDTTKHYRISADVYFESAGGAGFYMGGYGETAAGGNYTGNFDYTMAVYHPYELGSWITFAITRYGTDALSYNNSHDFSTTVGWTGDNGLCYKYFFGALWNYNGGGVMYVRNIRIQIVDPDTSNAIVRNSGISTINATVNKWSPLTGTRGWIGNYSATLTAITDYTAPTEPTDVIECFHPNVASAQPGHWAGTWATDYFNTSNQYYTIGTFFKKINGTIGNYGHGLLLSSWAGSNNTNYFYETIEIDDEWVFTYRTLLQNTVESVHPYIENSYQNGVTNRYSGMFCVEGARAIPIGTLASASKTVLSYGSFNDRDNYTLTGWFLPYTPFEADGDVYRRTTNQCALFYIRNSSGKGGSFRFYQSGGSSMPFLDTDDSNGSAHHAHTVYNVLMYVPLFWAFTKNGTTVSLKTYQNGILLGTHTNVLSDSTYYKLNTLTLAESSFPQWDGEHRGISVYSSVLADDVLLGIAKNVGSIRGTSEIVKGLTETARVIDDCYYDPLTGGSTAIARHDTPTIANAEGSYSMNALTNDAPNFKSWGQGGTYTVVNTPYGQGCKYISGAMWASWSGNSYAYIGFTDTIAPDNQYLAVSCWIYVSKDSDIDWLSMYNEFGGYTDYDLSKKGTWQNCKSFPQTTTNHQFYVYSAKYGVTNGTFSGYYIVCQPLIVQVAATPATTPMGVLSPKGDFATPNPPASDLTFNLYSTLDLYWSNPWSISYWKYPILTHTNDLAGYNIDSMGCNGNSVGTGAGYRWFGKNNGDDSIYVAGVNLGSFSPADYFGKWQFVSMIYNGSTIIYKFWLSNGNYYTFTDSIGSIANNHFLTQYGYDLKLGGWDDGGRSNALFRDLRVFKRAIITAEEENLYKLKYRIYKNKTIILSGKITEY